MKMCVSIVTISFNERNSITKTLQSVIGQTYKNIQYIVQDGGSTDGTVDVIQSCSNRIAIWNSEKDFGLYDGMNKGLVKCTGDYVLFCNAGDWLAASDVVEKMVQKAELDGLPDMVYGDCANSVHGKLMVRSAHGPSFMRFGMPASHEAIMYKLSVVRLLGLQYDLSHPIAADYKFTYQFVNAAKTFSYVPIPIVVFAEGGISTSNVLRGLLDASKVRKEVSDISVFLQCVVLAMQCGALFFSRFFRPIYCAFRLKAIE